MNKGSNSNPKVWGKGEGTKGEKGKGGSFEHGGAGGGLKKRKIEEKKG